MVYPAWRLQRSLPNQVSCHEHLAHRGKVFLPMVCGNTSSGLVYLSQQSQLSLKPGQLAGRWLTGKPPCSPCEQYPNSSIPLLCAVKRSRFGAWGFGQRFPCCLLSLPRFYCKWLLCIYQRSMPCFTLSRYPLLTCLFGFVVTCFVCR